MTATSPLPEKNLEDIVNRYLPFLIEIRKRLLFIGSFFLIFWILGFYYYEKIIGYSLKLLNLKGVNIVFTSPFQFLNLSFSSGLIVGTVAVFPLLILQLLSFLKPALKKNEYRLVIFLLPFSIFLFIAGFGFGILMMKYMIILLYEKSFRLNIGSFLDISKLLSSILITSTLMGLAFQFPQVLTILLRLKVIKYQTLASKRIFIYLGILLFVMTLPPTDILSDVLLTLPLVFLFEITLILNRFMAKT